MLTQEEVDQAYMEQQRKRKRNIAERIEESNAKLSFPKNYRNIIYYRTQYSTFVIPDAPKELEGMFTTATQLHRLIDAYLDRLEG